MYDSAFLFSTDELWTRIYYRIQYDIPFFDLVRACNNEYPILLSNAFHTVKGFIFRLWLISLRSTGLMVILSACWMGKVK